nr:GNAT family N-acetyltransferase [uncultured Draconibacterium sp.]
MIQIRKATIEDARYIALLGRVTFAETFAEYFRDEQDLFDYHEQTFSVSKITTSLEKENNCYWIAFWNELPVGYAKLKVFSATEFIETEEVAQLQKIYVLKEFLNKNVGKLLMSELMMSFNASDKSHIWLSVLKTNERAIKFYNKNKFEQVGEHLFQIGKEVFDFYVLYYEKASANSFRF